MNKKYSTNCKELFFKYCCYRQFATQSGTVVLWLRLQDLGIDREMK
jgi:hypothetical protein